jgi:rhamnosyl/mannosyltransferase
LGRLVPYKGFDVLLRALALIDAHLTIIGTGAQSEALRRLANKLGLADRVVFTGYLSNKDVRLHLWAAQVFAFPSTTDAETFGIAQLEAMAAGLPIVNTRLKTAVPLVARDGMEALTVPPNDPQALAAALSRFLDDDAMARKFGIAGQARVREEFGSDRFVERIHAIYRLVHETRPRQP